VWYAPGAPASRELWRLGDPGDRLNLRATVLNTEGVSVANALVELWHADSTGTVHAKLAKILNAVSNRSIRKSNRFDLDREVR